MKIIQKGIITLVFIFLSINIISCKNETLEEANKFLNEKKYVEAINKYKEVIKQQPDNKIALEKIQFAEENLDIEEANKLYENGQYVESIDRYKEALKKNPNIGLAIQNIDNSKKLIKLKDNMNILTNRLGNFASMNGGSYPVELDSEFKRDIVNPFEEDIGGKISPIILYDQYIELIENLDLNGQKITKLDLKGLVIYKPLEIKYTDNLISTENPIEYNNKSYYKYSTKYEIYATNEKGKLLDTFKSSYSETETKNNLIYYHYEKGDLENVINNYQNDCGKGGKEEACQWLNNSNEEINKFYNTPKFDKYISDYEKKGIRDKDNELLFFKHNGD